MIGVRLHDRYLLRAYWATFGAVLFFFTIIVLVLDLSDRLTRLARGWGALKQAGQGPYGLLVEFYGTLIPFVWLRILPFTAPLAAAFCLSRMVRHNELTPLLVGGVSKRRLALPILLSGVVVATGIFVVQETVVPRLSRRHNELLRLLSKAKPNRITDVPHLHDPQGGRLSMEAFHPLGHTMENVQITFRNSSGEATSIHRYPELNWDEASERWIASSGGIELPLERDRSGMARVPVASGEAAPLSSSLALVEISISTKAAMGVSRAEVQALRRANPESSRLVHMEHLLYTGPVSTIVLLLLTLPYAFPIGRRRSSPLPGIVSSGLAGALYFAASYLFGSLASSGDLNPVVMTWLPTVIFGALGVVLYLTMDDL